MKNMVHFIHNTIHYYLHIKNFQIILFDNDSKEENDTTKI